MSLRGWTLLRGAVVFVMLGAGAANALAQDAAAAAAADKAEEEPRRLLSEAYTAVVQAEQARDDSRLAEAVEYFAAALNAYQEVAITYPGWRTEIIEVRIPQCINELSALLQRDDLRRRFGEKVKPLLDKGLPRRTARVGSASTGERMPPGVAATGMESTLVEEIRALQEEREVLRSRLAAAEQKAEPSSPAGVREAYKDLKARYDELRKANDQLQRKCLEAERKAAALEVAERRAADERKARADMSKEMATIEAERDKLKRENARLQTKSDADLPAKYERLQRDYDKVLAECAALKLRVESSEEESASAAEAARPPAGAEQVEAARLLREGKLQKCREVVTVALKKNPEDYGMNLVNGMLLCSEGSYTQAVVVLKRLVDANSTDARVRVVLGGAYLALGRYSEARMELDVAVGFDPELVEARYDLAQVLLVAAPPDPEKAEEHYKEALRLGARPDPQFERRLQEALAKKGPEPKKAGPEPKK